MNATPRPYTDYSVGEIIQCLRHSTCSTQVEDEIARRLNTLDEAKAELADVFRCYERDNVDERRNNTGVNIHLTHKSAERIKALLADMKG